jgi:uroporphyrinogen-III synthase
MGRPLEGVTVVVTRPREQSGDLLAILEARGAVPLLAPAIRTSAAPGSRLARAANDLAEGAFAWAVFTSRAGVEAVLARLNGRPLRASVAAVGDGTASTLRQFGVEPDLVPSTFTTTALARAMPEGSGRVLLARADIAPEGMEGDLERKGWTPVRVDAYRTSFARRLPSAVGRAILEGAVDAVTFTSASTVTGFTVVASEALAEAPRRPRVVCIGPVTARAAREAGWHVDAVAGPHTIEGLVVALQRLFAERPRRRER